MVAFCTAEGGETLSPHLLLHRDRAFFTLYCIYYYYYYYDWREAVFNRDPSRNKLFLRDNRENASACCFNGVKPQTDS